MKTTTKILLGILSCISLSSCNFQNETKSPTPTEPPLNLVVLLDLSDRIARPDMTPTQKDRDIAIVNHLTEAFIAQCSKNNKISRSKNSMRVMFYPTPKIEKIATLASNLDVDLSKYTAKEAGQKKKDLKAMQSDFPSSLENIYQSTLKTGNWVGCDIWGLFSEKKVDQYCIREGYRNVMVILTDGFLYHVNNKQQQGNKYSYIISKMLGKHSSPSLIVKRKGLENLEVLMLEVNPYDPKTSQELRTILENWFKGMGVKKINVVETDLPTYTNTVIDNFIGK